MRKAKIKFRIVTPMILSGAKQEKAEMRAPSIRGALRFWFRTLGGSPEGEKKVFGGIGKNDEGGASSIIVRVKTSPQTKSNQKMEDVPTAERFDYLLWPLRNPQNARGVISDGQDVEIEILSRRVKDGAPLDERVVKALLLLGALGTRSRRAYGSIYPISAIFDGVEWDFPKTLDEFKAEITKLMTNVNCKILNLPSANSAKEAIQACSSALKRFRCGKDDERFGQKASKWGRKDHDLMMSGGGGEIYRAAVALPHQTKYYNAEINGFDRLASPVIFKIALLDNRYVPIVVFLKDYFIEEGANVRLRPKDRRGQPKTVTLSHDLLDEMMREYSDYWEGAECLFGE